MGIAAEPTQDMNAHRNTSLNYDRIVQYSGRRRTIGCRRVSSNGALKSTLIEAIDGFNLPHSPPHK